jgi:uncharacterized membrane protein YhaH (DUF805 family)
MSDPLQRATKARNPSWIAGRAAPREYWAWAFSLVMLGLALNFFLPENKLNSGFTVVLVLAQIRRLHDAGRTGWWALAAQLGPLVVLVPLLIVSPDLALGVGSLAEIIGIIWIGLLRQDTAENRFGSVPGRKPVADTFS